MCIRESLLSGAVVLKQEMGVVEWFEPLLQPWVHYVPVSSDLGNLSDAVRWVRANGGAARRMADAGAKLVDEALSARAMERYMRALLRGYAELHGGVVEPPTPAPGVSQACSRPSWEGAPEKASRESKAFSEKASRKSLDFFLYNIVKLTQPDKL